MWDIHEDTKNPYYYQSGNGDKREPCWSVCLMNVRANGRYIVIFMVQHTSITKTQLESDLWVNKISLDFRMLQRWMWKCCPFEPNWSAEKLHEIKQLDFTFWICLGNFFVIIFHDFSNFAVFGWLYLADFLRSLHFQVRSRYSLPIILMWKLY